MLNSLIFLSFLLVQMITTSLIAEIAATVPKYFTVQHSAQDGSSVLSITEDGKSFGVLKSAYTSSEIGYELFDADHGTLARITLRQLPSGVIFDVTDAEGYDLGFLEMDGPGTFPSFHVVSPSNGYTIFANQTLWKDTSHLGIGNTFVGYVFKDADDVPLGYILRPFFNADADWYIQISDSAFLQTQGVNCLLMLSAAVLQIDAKAWQTQLMTL